MTIFSNISYGLNKLNIIISIICIIYVAKDSIRNKKLHLFLPLILFSVFDYAFTFVTIDIVNDINFYNKASKVYQPLFICLEIITLAIFYKLGNPINKIVYDRTNKIIFISFLICIIFVYKNWISFYLSLVIFEFILINSFSIKIYFSLIKSSKTEISDSDHFINNGFFTFINLTAPFFIISDTSFFNEKKLEYSIYFINEIGYMIIFYSIIKSIRWKNKKL